ncbi:polyprenyl synthetase family protein, partial [Streptococcus suis]
AGQVLDMAGEGQKLSLEQLQAIHANKTGKLLTFPFVAAGLIAGQSDEVIHHLRKAGQLVGLAFQVRDDILDVTATFEEIGKTPQKDLLAEKSTYPALMGLEASKVFLEDS